MPYYPILDFFHLFPLPASCANKDRSGLRATIQSLPIRKMACRFPHHTRVLGMASLKPDFPKCLDGFAVASPQHFDWVLPLFDQEWNPVTSYYTRSLYHCWGGMWTKKNLESVKISPERNLIKRNKHSHPGLRHCNLGTSHASSSLTWAAEMFWDRETHQRTLRRPNHSLCHCCAPPSTKVSQKYGKTITVFKHLQTMKDSTISLQGNHLSATSRRASTWKATLRLELTNRVMTSALQNADSVQNHERCFFSS